jgi:hypothetical protein
MFKWEFSLGFYPGILIGFRSYEQDDRNNHVLYIPFIDLCLTMLKDVDEPNK